MYDEETGYDNDVLMAACIQAAAIALTSSERTQSPIDPNAIVEFAAQIRDEALSHM